MVIIIEIVFNLQGFSKSLDSILKSIFETNPLRFHQKRFWFRPMRFKLNYCHYNISKLYRCCHWWKGNIRKRYDLWLTIDFKLNRPLPRRIIEHWFSENDFLQNCHFEISVLCGEPPSVEEPNKLPYPELDGVKKSRHNLFWLHFTNLNRRNGVRMRVFPWLSLNRFKKHHMSVDGFWCVLASPEVVWISLNECPRKFQECDESWSVLKESFNELE